MMAPFTARDGENLALYEWPLDNPDDGYADSEMPQASSGTRGLVLIVHGLGEHALRYDHVATTLMDWGFTVRAYDQRGHGRSGGVRGVMPSDTALLDDLAEIAGESRLRCQRLCGAAAPETRRNGPPLILLGHSLGGLLASRFVSLNPQAVDGLVLCSPAFDAGFSLWQKLLLAVLPRLVPDLALNNRLDVRDLSRNSQVVARYQTDARVHKKISPRLARFIDRASRETLATAAQWSTPTLLMYAGADRIVRPAGSAAFANRAAMSPSVKPGTVTARCFSEHYHELFNEDESEPVFLQLSRWLNENFKPEMPLSQPMRAQAATVSIAKGS